MSSAGYKGVNILLAGSQELQEIHILVSARLRDTQEDEVFLNTGRRRRPFGVEGQEVVAGWRCSCQ